MAEPKDQPGFKPRRANFGLLGPRTSGSCLHLQGVISFGIYDWDFGGTDLFLPGSQGWGEGVGIGWNHWFPGEEASRDRACPAYQEEP